MHLTERAMENSTVLGKVQPPSHYLFLWWEHRRDPAFNWEGVQPKHHKVDELDLHSARDFLKGQHVDEPPRLFLHSSNCTFSFTDMYFAVVVLHSTAGKRSLIFSNTPSIEIVLTTNPAHWYTFNTYSMCFANALAIRTGTRSVVTNSLFLDTVSKNSISFTKNTSAVIEIILFHSTSNWGTTT